MIVLYTISWDNIYLKMKKKKEITTTSNTYTQRESRVNEYPQDLLYIYKVQFEFFSESLITLKTLTAPSVPKGRPKENSVTISWVQEKRKYSP